MVHTILGDNRLKSKKTLPIILRSFLLLVLSACHTIPATQPAITVPEATTPATDQLPDPTPTDKVIIVSILTDTPDDFRIEGYETVENVEVVPYAVIPPGQSLVYSDWETGARYLLSKDGLFEDIKISNHWGTFSLDGKKFTYISSREFLVIYDLENQTKKQVPISNECYGFSSWSPEGNQLALECNGGGIYVYSEENDTFKHLTNWGHPSVDYFLFPEWSPDGKWVAYAYRQLSSLSLLPMDGVYIIEVDCLNAPLSCKDRTRGPFIPRSDPSTARIAWSPDSCYLAIYHSQGPLYVVDLVSNDIRQIDLGLDHIHRLTWSPDGDWITFNVERTIYQISPGGDGPFVVAEDKGHVESFIIKGPAGTPSTPSLEFSQPLSELLLTWQDVDQYYQSSETYTYINSFFADEVHTIKDLSKQLDESCSFECTKQVWSTEPKTDIGLDEKEFTYYRRAVIEMVRSENQEQAAEVADDLFNEYTPYLEDEIDVDDSPNMVRFVIAPIGNTRIGMIETLDGEPGYNVLLTTSYGPISYRVLSYIPPWSDDFTTDVQLAIDFVNAQISKFQSSAPP